MAASGGRGDWILCADWLVRCQILTRDQRAALPTATINDLHHALRDGVLICLLINRLRPKTIDLKDFSQRPQMSQFLCLKNLKVFLQACKNYFEMSESSLFKPYDLFDGSDMQKVIASLSTLSQTSVARLSKIEPFVLVNGGSSSSAYMNMDCLDDCDDGSDEETYYILLDNEEDDVYGDLIALKNSRVNGSHRTNDALGRHVPVAPDTTPKSHYDLCVNELVTTEENYVKCLTMLTKTFMAPLQAVMSPKDFHKIFAYCEKLYEVHTQFSKDLRMASQKQSVHTIADCFIMNKEKFLIYGEYCSNLLQAQDLLDHVCNTVPLVQKRVVELQTQASEDSHSSFKLRDLLTVPMQRVLKYHLLLKELVKHTAGDNQEKRSLEKALEEMQDLSLCVNEVKRDNEMLHSLAMVQKSIQNLPLAIDMSLKDYGRLLLDGEIKVKYERNNSQRHVFVLDQLVIICKTRGDVYEYCSSFAPGNCDIDETVVKDWNSVWFSMTDRNSRETFHFGAKKEDMRKKWMDAMKMAQTNTRPLHAQNNLHNFTMATFHETTICDVCRKLLRGIIFQGYRCTKTKMSVHKECLSKAKDMRGPPSIPPKIDRSKAQSFVGKGSPTVHGSQTSKGKFCAISGYDGVPPPIGNRTALTFEKGSVIDVIADDGDFYEGQLNGRVGFFPKNFVQRRPRTGNPEKYLDVKTSENGVSLVLPTNNAANVFTDNSLEARSWFVGNMDRHEAVSCLQSLPENVFLVRVNDERYALSLKYGGQPKHIKIHHGADGSYYLASCHVFPSISALIDYYQKNTLEKIFPEVKTPLQIPYKDAIKKGRGGTVIGYCIAQYDYEATATNQISLREGDGIAIVSKAGEATGWWKGNNKGQLGYFPYAYVKEIDN